MPDMHFSVIDVETTGYWAKGTDRIVELAVVRLNQNFEVIDEWVSLINPDRDPGPLGIHGVPGPQLSMAPSFEMVAPDVLTILDGSIPVAHNAPFDRSFLLCEFDRCGYDIADVEWLCTLRMAHGSALGKACQRFGIELIHAHSALGDARATAELLPHLLDGSRPGVEPDSSPWPTPMRPPSGSVVLRADSPAPIGAGRLDELVSALPPAEREPAEPAAAEEYWRLLNHVLEDRLVSDDELENLRAVADELSLTQEQVLDAHYRYISILVRSAWADGVVTGVERQDVLQVGALLSADLAALEEWLDSGDLDESDGQLAEDLAGLTVCFSGDAGAMSRSDLEELAVQCGMSTWPRVTKKVDLLVLADPYSNSGKAKKAREYGIRIMSEMQFMALARTQHPEDH